MAARDQLGFVEAFASPKLGRNVQLDRIAAEVKWYRFAKLLGKLEPEAAGRPPYDPLMMFKALLLAQFYNLSDADLELAPTIGSRSGAFSAWRWRAMLPTTRRCAASATG